MASVLLVHNPKSGFGRTGAEDLVAAIRAAGHTVSYQSVRTPDFACALEEPGDVVAAAGGDGTVSKVARLLVGRDVPIAVLPLGTANNVAKAIGHTGALEDLIARWDPGSSRPFDLGMARGAWGCGRFLESFGIGMFARRVEDDAKGGRKASAGAETAAAKLEADVEAFRALVGEFKPRRVTVVVEGEEVSGEFLLVEVMNVSTIGPNLAFAAGADPSDGVLDVAMLPAHEAGAFDNYLRHVLEAGTPPRSGLVVRRAKSVRLSWAKLPAQFDGEYVPDHSAPGQERWAEIGVRRGAVRFVGLV